MKAALLVSLSILFILLVSSSSSSATNTLHKYCKKASKCAYVDYNVCVTSLQVDPKIHHAGIKGLAILAANYTKANFTATKARIESFLSDGKEDKALMDLCLASHKLGILHIKPVLHFIEANDIVTALLAMVKVVSAPHDCDNAITDSKKYKVSPLKEETDNGRQLTHILLAFISYLQH